MESNVVLLQGLYSRSGLATPLRIRLKANFSKSTCLYAWEAQNISEKICGGKNKPFLKKVASLHGDRIELGDNGLILINGVPFPDSAPRSHDRAGRFLRAFELPITLTSDDVWLPSESPFGFDSRYLGTAKLSKCHKAVPLFTF